MEWKSYDKLFKAAAEIGFVPMLMNFKTGELYETHDYINKYTDKLSLPCIHDKGTWKRTRTFSDGTRHTELMCAICNKHIKFIKNSKKYN